ncbi:MAG TPA: hypothetical protein VFS42_11440, partial [Burkholderiaceae bacterium]|nr:hypothetical protein [Burkholderiaceae bacterium]
MFDQLFRRRPEDDAIPVLTEIIEHSPTAQDAPPPTAEKTAPLPAPEADAAAATPARDESLEPVEHEPVVQASMPVAEAEQEPPAQDESLAIQDEAQNVHAPAFEERAAPAREVSPAPSEIANEPPSALRAAAAFAAPLPSSEPLHDARQAEFVPPGGLTLSQLHPRIGEGLEQRIDHAIRTSLEDELPLLRDRIQVAIAVAVNDTV